MTAAEHFTVGLVGIGLLGTAIAERLLGGGYNVVGFDLDASKCRQLELLGGVATSSPSEVAATTKRMLLSLPDSAVVASVITEIQKDLGGVEIIIDTTTGDPEDSERLAALLAEHQVDFVDATIAGSSKQARQGQVLVMAGGTAQAYERCVDIFDAFCVSRFHVGGSGSGAKMKLVVNLAIGLNRAVLAEALAFGESFGFDSAKVLEVLRAGPGHSRMMDSKGEKMVRRDFAPEARLRQHLKDVRLILAAAQRNAAHTPLTELHANLLETLAESGFGDEDNSAILRAFLRE